MIRFWQGALLAGLAGFQPACFFVTDSCFVRGTRVGTPRGRRNIEDLQAGDEVWSFDLAERRFVVRRVGKVLRALANEVFRVEAGEHAIPGVTASHPFFDAASATYVRVDELTVRSQLLVSVAEGEIATRPLGAIARLPVKGEVEIFNLSVDGEEHNYFAEGILVHNKSPIEQGGSGGTTMTTSSTGGSGGTAGEGGTGGRTDSGGSGGGHTGGGGSGGGHTGGSGGATGGAGGATGGEGGATGGAGGASGGTGGM